MNDTWTMTEESTSLRDQFAMAAMQGDWAAQSPELGQFATCSDEDLERHAKDYYRIADAMLKVRVLPKEAQNG